MTWCVTRSKPLQELQGRCVGNGVSTAGELSFCLVCGSWMRRWRHQTTPGALSPSFPLSGLVSRVAKCQASQVTHWHLSHSHFCLCPNRDGQQQLQLFLVKRGSPCSLECEAAGCLPWLLGLCQACINSLGKGEAEGIPEAEMRSLCIGNNENSAWHGHQSKLSSDFLSHHVSVPSCMPPHSGCSSPPGSSYPLAILLL